MRKCRFCAKEIADTATTCPHCKADLFPGRAVAVVADPPLLPIAPVPIARVTVVDIDMPFNSMVGFMVKWAIAAIPAILIVTFILVGVGLAIGLFTGLLGWFSGAARAVR